MIDLAFHRAVLSNRITEFELTNFRVCIENLKRSLFHRRFRTVTQTLVGRNPSDKVQGSFTFTIFVRKSSVPKSEQEASKCFISINVCSLLR